MFVTHVRKRMKNVATMAWSLLYNLNLHHFKCEKIKTVFRDKVPHKVFCDISYGLSTRHRTFRAISRQVTHPQAIIASTTQTLYYI